MRVKWINESQHSQYLENKARDRSQEAGPSAWGSGDVGDVRVIGEVVDKTWAQEEGRSCSAGVTGRGGSQRHNKGAVLAQGRRLGLLA